MRELDYGRLIKALRRERNLTQEALAHELGVTYATVNGWENGRRRPMPFLAKRLVQVAHEAGIEVTAFEGPEGQSAGE